MNTHLFGVSGEEMAAKYLKKNKYKILERNFRAARGEIDIIAKDGEYVVFIEVKRRMSDKFGLPREAVTDMKQKTIINCASYWLAKNNMTGCSVRFDVVEVYGENVHIIKDAFRV